MKSDRYVLACMVLALTASCAQLQAPEQPATPSSTPTSEPASAPEAAAPPAQSALTAQLMYELLVGEMTFDQGDGQAGAGYLLDAARRTGDALLYKRATEMAIRSRSGPAALAAARAWRQAFPDSVQAARFELQVLIALGRIADTEAPARKLLAALPASEQESFINALPTLYRRVPDPAEAARAVQAALREAIQTPALAPAAWTTIGRLRLQAGDQRGALSAATLAQSASAASEWPALLGLQLLAEARMPDAEALVRRYLDEPRALPEVRIAYARTLVEQGRADDAHAQLDTLARQQPDYAQGWLVQGALFADERRDDQAEQALRRYLQLTDARQPAQSTQSDTERDESGRDQARMMLARIAERRGDLAGAEQLLGQINSPDQSLAVQVRRAEILARQGKLDQARQAIRAAPERDPEDARDKLLAEAQLLREHQQPEPAYQMLTGALQTAPDDQALLYDAAITADRADRPQDMERLLRHLIEVNPNSASAYNALGYWLADHDERLPEAKTLIEKAVQLAPDDYFIQDSLGWVQFRLGQLEPARDLLQAAYKKHPDPEIAAHLGEVLWALGQHEAARAVWAEGQRLEPDNDTLRKTLERLQVTQ